MSRWITAPNLRGEHADHRCCWVETNPRLDVQFAYVGIGRATVEVQHLEAILVVS